MRPSKQGKNPDDFWDISDLIPRKERRTSYARATDAVEIQALRTPAEKKETEAESSSVLVRYIEPTGASRLTSAAESYDSVESYLMEASLIHEVTLKKHHSAYSFYREFLDDALRYYGCHGRECDFVSFFSYVPQYNQLNDQQLAYYLWFRDCFYKGERIRTEYSYVLLLIYELINLGNRVDVRESQRRLVEIWYAYYKEFPALAGKLSEWICDFSLLHRLPPPESADERLVSKAPTLKEYYLPMPDYDVDGCARSLLKYCSSYDYHTSKFATKENLPLFDKHVFAVLTRAIAYYSSDGKILSDLAFEDSRLIRDAFSGALCTADARVRIEVRYCSFSRSNELRFLVGDLVKYAENKIRTYVGVKSKMTVYSIPTELQRTLDEYFTLHLPGKRVTKPKPTELHPYEALYEPAKKPLSLSEAARIEEASWVTTELLVSAFEEETTALAEPIVAPVMKPTEMPKEETDEATELATRLGDCFPVVMELMKGNPRALHKAAGAMGKMPDALADSINEIAVEVYGDALIEESDGGYSVIEDYLEYLIG